MLTQVPLYIISSTKCKHSFCNFSRHNFRILNESTVRQGLRNGNTSMCHMMVSRLHYYLYILLHENNWRWKISHPRNGCTSWTNSPLEITSWLNRTKHLKKFSYTSWLRKAFLTCLQKIGNMYAIFILFLALDTFSNPFALSLAPIADPLNWQFLIDSYINYKTACTHLVKESIFIQSSIFSRLCQSDIFQSSRFGFLCRRSRPRWWSSYVTCSLVIHTFVAKAWFLYSGRVVIPHPT